MFCKSRVKVAVLLVALNEAFPSPPAESEGTTERRRKIHEELECRAMQAARDVSPRNLHGIFFCPCPVRVAGRKTRSNSMDAMLFGTRRVRVKSRAAVEDELSSSSEFAWIPFSVRVLSGLRARPSPCGVRSRIHDFKQRRAARSTFAKISAEGRWGLYHDRRCGSLGCPREFKNMPWSLREP